ncbi:MAG: sugar phosphate nucleotidyltransferase [Candidatus Wallbacteria bacterium]|nr:sugar phosphate nucleotidyltransferase [Candidatus Wallbacteria bacterium]
MKVIIPVAGVGTRLAPFTYTLPKVLLPVAGKPMLGHTLDKLKELRDVSEVIFIIGHLGELIREYVRDNYNFKASYIEQTERLGLGHAIHLAREICLLNPEPVLIVLGDTLFEIKGRIEMDPQADGLIAVKSVDDPKRFGIAEVEGDLITRLVEKPEQPKSNLAIIGVYYFKNTVLLFECLDEIIRKNIRTKNEFQITDAMQLMLDKHARLKAIEIEAWYDCGKTETLLSTNRELLRQSGSVNHGKVVNSVIIPPVNIDEQTEIENSVIGPYVSVTGAKIKNSVIRDSIINRDSTIENTIFSGSLVGQGASIIENFKQFNIGDSSQYITTGSEIK